MHLCRVVKFLLSLIPVRVILYESRVLTLSAELGVRERRRRTTDDGRTTTTMLRRTTTTAATETLRAVRSVGWGPGAGATTASTTTRGVETTALLGRTACASRAFQTVAAATATTSGARADRRDALWTHPAQMVARRGWKRANRRVEVILKESIEGLGDADEVVRVRPGRARNHLVPERLATYVNAEKLAAAQERLARREAERAESEEGEEAEAVSTAEAERARKVSGFFFFFRRMCWTRHRWRSFNACERHLR